MAHSILLSAVYDKHAKLDREKADISALSQSTMHHVSGAVGFIAAVQCDIWGIARLVLGLFLLYSLMGTLCFVFFIPVMGKPFMRALYRACLISCLVSLLLALPNENLKIYWRKIYRDRLQARIDSTRSIIAQIRTIKMMGLVPVLSIYLQRQQTAEIQALLSSNAALARTFIACE